MSQEFEGPLTVTSAQGVQGGSLELGATVGAAPETPYVDFHFGLGAAQDFNVRLINTADNQLDVITATGGPVVSIQGDKIGIGTTTPGAKLVVNEFAGGAELRVDGQNGLIGLSLGADAAQPWVGTRTNHALRLLTNNTEQVRVQANGRVGIGTTTPGALLEIRGSGDPLCLLNHTGASGNPALWLQQEGVTKAFLWWDQANNRLNLGTPTTNPIISLHNSGNVGIGTTTPNRLLHVQGEEIHSGGFVGGLSFGNRETAGFVQAPANGERWVWYATAGVARLWSGTDKVLVNTSGVVRATHFIDTSSRELKANIAELSGSEALATLENLTPVKFHYKAESDKKLHVGFIAEDVPALVATADRKGLSAMDIVAVLTKAVQEQLKTIAALGEKIKMLEAQIA